MIAAWVLALSACGKDETRATPQAPEAGYIVAKPERVAVERPYPARLVASQSSDVRPQVTGVIQRRLFEEGSVVRAGQPLYRIDPSLFLAAVDEGAADLEAAMANLASADELVERSRPLVSEDAITPQEYTNAVATARAARAAVHQAEARLRTARINLRFTTVPAPLGGRIGRSLVTPGALATTNQAEPLATIQQLDPIMVDIQQSAPELMALRRAIADGGLEPNRAEVRLTLAGGETYPLTGVVKLSEVVVNPETGAITLRARMPNPRGVLMPGLFVRARFAQSAAPAAYLVPQPALLRDPQGAPYVYVIDERDHVRRRPVKAVDTSGDAWIVTSGLNSGDRVATEGLGRLRPDMVVRPVAAGAGRGAAARAPDRTR